MSQSRTPFTLPFFTAAALRRRVTWLIRIRWLAIVVFGIGIALGCYFPAIHVQCKALVLILIGLVLVNAIYILLRDYVIRQHKDYLINLIVIQMVGDLLILTVLIHFTGGIESPLYFFYLFHIITAAVIFPGTRPYGFAGLAVILYTTLLGTEWLGVLPHFNFYEGVDITRYTEIVVFTWLIFLMTIFLSTYLAKNVTDRYRRVRTRLEFTNRRLQELNRAKTNFLRVSSHELKAPISTIQSTLAVIHDILHDQVDDRVLDMAARSMKKTEEMIALLNDLSDLTYGDLRRAGEFVETDLRELVQEVLQDEKITASAHHITLDAEMPKSPVKLVCDPDAIRKVLRNLVTNGVRYTPESGSVLIRLMDASDEILLEVRDTGIGIAASDLKKIFHEFYRTPQAKSVSSAGSGLGLAIVERLVDEHGGYVTVESIVDQGSTFQVHFPKEIVP
ncbi:MAG: HAMP domain-containing histidine kinase [Lentisphaeria bacterium]|nr:HAMP domain-containing histidine kinase [Candidatus Neomarinimicrobiota bacterium]MCF7842493.1 HAMP domain-containing histidine kinase [Lentisphaeria bacterium]